MLLKMFDQVPELWHFCPHTMGKALVIVESPAKAKTIANYLGSGFMVESSIGHIRDLPKRAADVPAEYKKLPWARLGVDVENDFKPLYLVDPEKKKHIAKLKGLLKEADELYLATDEDREGESIAWHLLEVLGPKIPVKRMVFHEITKGAIQAALKSPRELDRKLVDAQEARRILDRLYGFEVSSVLWKKVLPKLSAGRVQSVATKIIVERERERMAFRSATWWGIKADLKKDGLEFESGLLSWNQKKIATGKDFDEQGKLTSKEHLLLGAKEAESIRASLEQANFAVASVERKPNKRSPYAPFITSTLQQEAGRAYRFSASRTMRAAQRLYENGYITYMRTDSTTLSEGAIKAARTLILEQYGKEYLPDAPRQYTKKVKNAQEAHEAIRPAGDAFQSPEKVAREMGPDEAKVYEIIWKRTVASQMNDAIGESVIVRIHASSGTDLGEFGASGNTIVFPGFLRAYVEGSDDPEAELENKERHLPPMKEGETIHKVAIHAESHETQPPARYTESSLVKKLEELGVGRPSTYASIIGTIQDRGYVWKKGTALIPSFTAFAVIGLLEKHFSTLVSYAFTAKMEDDLDMIATGERDATPWLTLFYFGHNSPKVKPELSNEEGLGLLSLVTDGLSDIDARAINSLPLGTDDNGTIVNVRVGRYGPYLERGEDTVSVREDTPPDELTLNKALELLSAPKSDSPIGNHPETGEPIFVKVGRYGAYVQQGVMDNEADKKEQKKPKTSSLFSTMKPETTTLEDALQLLSLPRTIGKDDDGVDITAQLGRFGPYISKNKDSRTIESEEKLLTMTLDEAKAILAMPRTRGVRRVVPPLKELGEDPVSKKPIVLKEGRFGLYVTDGETMASIHRGDTIEGLSNERAQELLAMRREKDEASGKTKKKPASPKKTKEKAEGASIETLSGKPKAAKKTGKKTANKSTKKAAKQSTAEKE